MEKSMLDVAYEVVCENNNPISFSDLLNEVAKRLQMTEEEVKRRVSRFYTNLSLDGRFITLGDNVWDLRSKHPFKMVHIDMNDVYTDTDEEDEENSKRDDNESEVELGLGEKGKEDEFGFEQDDSEEESEEEAIF